MAELIKLNIDGKDVEVEPGTLIIKAAEKLGVEIPTFCYDDRLKSVGACRMCLVEVEKAPKLIASCATPVNPGMVVKTNSEKVVKARKAILEFILINHPLDCPTCDKGGECPLQNQTLKYGPTESRYIEDKIRQQDDPNQKFDDIRLGPEVWMNKNRCIMCFKCVRIARDLAGNTDLGIFQRGALARVDIPSEVKYASEFSGNTVENCPVGALMSDSFRYKIRNWLLESADSVSWLCPDGSNITGEHNQGKIYRHSSRRNDNIDEGFLSDKDRYGFDITSHPERIRLPMADDTGTLDKKSYEEALAIAVHRFTEIKSESNALLLDTTLTNEEAFSVSEFFHTHLSGSHIAISSELALDKVPAASLGLSTTISELENADMVIIAGCDLASEHPIIGLRIKTLIREGIPVYFISHRQVNLGRFDVVNIRSSYGREYDTVEKIIALKNGDTSVDFENDTKGRLLNDLSSSKNVHIFCGADLLSNPGRQKYLKSIEKLAGILKAKLSMLTTETNYIGVKLCGQINSSLDEIISKIENGQIKTLFIAGGDPVNIYPDRKRIVNALNKVDYLIYWGAFLNSTSKHAALIFPSVLPTENAGSYINIERRLQFMKKPYSHNKGIVSLIRLFTDIKTELGSDELYYSASEVFKKMSKAIPEFNGLTYQASEGHVSPIIGMSGLDGDNDTIEINPQSEYPYLLSFSRSVYYGASGMTSKSRVLQKLTPTQKLIINRDDAVKESIQDGSGVKLETSSGSGEFIVSLSNDVNKGELTLFGYSEDSPPNMFMNGYNKPVFAKISRV